MKTIVIFTAFTFTAGILSAQTKNTLQDAFNTSYTLEYKVDYKGAIATLKKDYDAKNYELNLRLGWLYYEAGLYTESIDHYKKAIALKPYSLEARFGCIYPASALYNWDDVITLYKDILKVDPQQVTANYRLGMIYYERKDYAAAQKYFEKYVNLYPFDYDAVLMNAWTNYRLGKNNEAKVLFNKALLIRPADTSALEGLGLIK